MKFYRDTERADIHSREFAGGHAVTHGYLKHADEGAVGRVEDVALHGFATDGIGAIQDHELDI